MAARDPRPVRDTRRRAAERRAVAAAHARGKRKPQEDAPESAPEATSLLLTRMATDAAAPKLSAAQLLSLQERHGNAAVSRLISPPGQAHAQTLSRTPTEDQQPANGALQRSPDDDVSPEQEFLDDMESGLGKANEYMQYITDAVDYWQEYGGAKPGALLDAAQNLQKITKRISDGVDKFAKPLKLLQKAIKIKEWAKDAADFADKTIDLDIQDKASRDAWIKSTETLADSSKPFIEAAQSWLTGLAIEGSSVAARASVVLAVVGAYAQVGWAALKAGIKNVEAYFARFGPEGTEQRKIDEAEHGRQVPPEPAYPGAWTSAAEKRAIWDRMQKDYDRRQRLAPFYAKLRQARAALEQAQQRFQETGFIKPYQRIRGQILYRVLREMKTMRLKQNSAGGFAAGRWFDCFLPSGGESYFDELAGVQVYPAKDNVDAEEAEFEINNFRGLANGSIPCPYFDEAYVKALAKFLAKQKAAIDQAEADLAKAQAQ